MRLKHLLALCLLAALLFASGAGAASFTVTPATLAVSRATPITVKGTGTSWVSGTTLTVSGGTSPVITGVSVNTGTQTITATLNPGAATGTLTLGDSTDSATASVTVASSVTVSGSNLTSWTSGPLNLFDATNEFTADAVGHTITVSGGTGFTAGTYTVSGFSAATSMGAQGTHNIVQVCALNNTAAGPAAGAASGGAWSYTIQAGGGGFAGSNLTAWSKGNAYYFDPDAPIASGMNGKTVTISGAGFTSGTYTITNYLAAYGTGTQGTQNMIQVSPISSIYPAPAMTTGGTWAAAGGSSIPTATVNTAYHGPIKLLLIGDSITQRQGSTTLAALQAQYPNAASVSVVNQGASGTKTSDWLPTNTTSETTPGTLSTNLFYTAVTAANGATVASIMLGTNDAKVSGQVSSATFTSNLQAIVTGLFANIPTLRKVVLQEAPYVVPGSGSGSWDATGDTALTGYYTAYSSITGTGVVVGVDGSYGFFSSNPQDLVDGIHPTTAGTGAVNYYWQQSLASSLTAIINSVFRGGRSAGSRAGSRIAQ